MEQAAAADEATEGRLGMLGSQGLPVLPAALVLTCWLLLPGLLVTYLIGLRGVAAWGFAPLISTGTVALSTDRLRTVQPTDSGGCRPSSCAGLASGHHH